MKKAAVFGKEISIIVSKLIEEHTQTLEDSTEKTTKDTKYTKDFKVRLGKILAHEVFDE